MTLDVVLFHGSIYNKRHDGPQRAASLLRNRICVSFLFKIRSHRECSFQEVTYYRLAMKASQDYCNARFFPAAPL